jgi:hypothetical protein
MHLEDRRGKRAPLRIRTGRSMQMATKKIRNKTERRESDRLLMQGLQQKDPGLTIEINNTQYKGPDVVNVLGKRISLGDATDTAHGAWIGAANAETSYVKQTQPVVNDMKGALRKKYGQDATSLAIYGLTPEATRTPTTAVKAEAVKKRAATKAAGGKKAEQKAAVAQAEAAVPSAAATPVQPAAPANKQQ